MTLDEIKEWREQNNVEFDDEGMVLRSVDWLIAEVDRLTYEQGALCEIYNSIEKKTANACAEIVDEDRPSYDHFLLCKHIANKIRKEFL